MPALCVMAELRLRVMRYGWVEGPRYALCLSAHNAAWGRNSVRLRKRLAAAAAAPEVLRCVFTPPPHV